MEIDDYSFHKITIIGDDEKCIKTIFVHYIIESIEYFDFFN